MEVFTNRIEIWSRFIPNGQLSQAFEISHFLSKPSVKCQHIEFVTIVTNIKYKINRLDKIVLVQCVERRCSIYLSI